MPSTPDTMLSIPLEVKQNVPGPVLQHANRRRDVTGRDGER